MMGLNEVSLSFHPFISSSSVLCAFVILLLFTLPTFVFTFSSLLSVENFSQLKLAPRGQPTVSGTLRLILLMISPIIGELLLCSF